MFGNYRGILHRLSLIARRDAEGRYTQYKMRTQSAWATSDVHLSQSEHDQWHFEGFPNLESYQVFLSSSIGRILPSPRWKTWQLSRLAWPLKSETCNTALRSL